MQLDLMRDAARGATGLALISLFEAVHVLLCEPICLGISLVCRKFGGHVLPYLGDSCVDVLRKHDDTASLRNSHARKEMTSTDDNIVKIKFMSEHVAFSHSECYLLPTANAVMLNAQANRKHGSHGIHTPDKKALMPRRQEP